MVIFGFHNMAAGNENYHTKKLNYKKGTVRRSPIALLNADVATLKERFYLDSLFMLPGFGFIGGTKVGTFNHGMHNQSRVVGFKWHKGGQMDSYNDAGLNTLGKSDVPLVESAKVGDIKLSATLFTSAYFVSTSEYGFQYYQDGIWVSWGGFGALGAAQTTNKSLSAVSIPGFKAGDTVLIRTFLINNEGYYASSANSMVLEVSALIMKFNGSWPSLAFKGTNTATVWADFLPLGLGTSLYVNSQMDDVPAVSSGYYVLNNEWYEVRQEAGALKMKIINQGLCEFGSYPSGDPGNSYPEPERRTGYLFTSYGQADQYINTCLTEHGGNGTLFSPYNNVWYSNWSSTTGEFSNLYTGYLMESASCEVGYYSNGTFMYYM